MEAKVKEEVPDKEYNQPSTTERRKSTTSGKEHRSPEEEEARASPTPGPPSPQNNGTAGLSSTESLSPPLEASRAPALQRLRRFLSALHQFACDVGAETGERVRQLIYNLMSGATSVEEFQAGVQESTNYPLRASVPGFLRALLPLAQRDLAARARRSKQTPLQYIRCHDHLILESGGDGVDIFHPQPSTDVGVKRRASDPFYETGQTNGSHEEYPPQAKRPPALYPSPFLYPGAPALIDCPAYPPYHGTGEHAFERRDGGISVRDVSSMTAPFAGGARTDDEWRNINTMLNCILSMVEKTKRALAILQQRGGGGAPEAGEGRAAGDAVAAALRHAEERVADVRRRAEDAVNQVKRQALLELQRAFGAAESKALELSGAAGAAGASGALGGKRHSPPPARDLSPTALQHQNCCWNCGRAARETCSGCGAARYCGAFCQLRDWEHHHPVCSGREQKPTALLRTSPPSKPPLPRAATPSTTTTTTPTDRLLLNDRLPLTDRLPLPDRMLPQERPLSSDRLALATMTSAQGMIGMGKK